MSGSKRPYHHGDLRTALLRAGEEELEEKGCDRFSLRSVAKRAGVSHAAPAHHFGDVDGLMGALAATGFKRMLDMQKARQAEAPPDAEEQLVQTGLGYIDFALACPSLFRLMFGNIGISTGDQVLQENAEAAFNHLVTHVSAITGGQVDTDPQTRTNVASVWAMVHGLADLMIGGAPRYLTEAPVEEREKMLRQIISGALIK